MIINISISEPFTQVVSEALLQKAAQIALQHVQQEEKVELTLVIEDDSALQDLNFRFLGIDSATDVLSFPANDVDPDSGNLYLGDIIISFPRALVQAETAGHPVESELQLLVVHGVLHLSGYDHDTLEGKQEMWNLQSQILSRLDVTLSRMPGEQS